MAVAAALLLAGCSSSGERGSGDGVGSSSSSSSSVSGIGSGDELVTASVAATQADSGEWRDGTMRIKFSSGSRDDVTGHINCSAISHLLEENDGLVMVYPDGELDCRAER